MDLQGYLLSVIIAYIIFGLYKFRKSIKWADNIPGRKDWFFYKLVFRIYNAEPKGKDYFCFVTISSTLINICENNNKLIYEMIGKFCSFLCRSFANGYGKYKRISEIVCIFLLQ